MKHKRTFGRRLFQTSNLIFLLSLSILCVLPLIHVFALSLSSSSAVAANKVFLWPVELTAASYKYVLSQDQFLTSFIVTLKRVCLGTLISMLLNVLIAYPLSKDPADFKYRTHYTWFFVLTMLFNGGLIPWYIVIKSAGMLDTIWALVLPGAVAAFNVVLLLNFFRGLPKELNEAARIDGSGHVGILWRIYVPLSLPAIATLTLFTIVGHWNSWFDGLILMNTPEHYPLQSFLQTVVIKLDLSQVTERELSVLQRVSNRTNRAAQIFVATLPIILVYPFLQRFFIKGMVLGSVKE